MRQMRRVLAIWAMLGVIHGIAACSGTDVSRPDWSQGYQAARGHEDITRFAVERAHEWLGRVFYPKPRVGDEGPSSKNPLVRGNYDTDFAAETPLGWFLDIETDSNSEYQSLPEFQSLHFMRGFWGGRVETLEEACAASRQRIVDLSVEALRLVGRGKREQAFYFLGAASHVIQDSFSEAHASRSPGGRGVRDMCTYIEEFPGVCVHTRDDVLSKDRVWQVNAGCSLDPSNRDWECLKGEAQRAATVSGGYLAVMAAAIEGRYDLEDALNSFFDGFDHAMPSAGYFQCAGR